MPGRSTSLTLLAADGPFTVTFSPALSPDQYGELSKLLATEALAMEDYCQLLAELSLSWGVDFACDTTGMKG